MKKKKKRIVGSWLSLSWICFCDQGKVCCIRVSNYAIRIRLSSSTPPQYGQCLLCHCYWEVTGTGLSEGPSETALLPSPSLGIWSVDDTSDTYVVGPKIVLKNCWRKLIHSEPARITIGELQRVLRVEIFVFARKAFGTRIGVVDAGGLWHRSVLHLRVGGRVCVQRARQKRDGRRPDARSGAGGRGVRCAWHCAPRPHAAAVHGRRRRRHRDIQAISGVLDIIDEHFWATGPPGRRRGRHHDAGARSLKHSQRITAIYFSLLFSFGC